MEASTHSKDRVWAPTPQTPRLGGARVVESKQGPHPDGRHSTAPHDPVLQASVVGGAGAGAGGTHNNNTHSDSKSVCRKEMPAQPRAEQPTT